MSDTARVLALYAELNPVPDVSSLVTDEALSSTTHEGGRLRMSDTMHSLSAKERTTQPPPPRLRWGWAVTAIVLVVLAIAWLARTSTEEPDFVDTVPETVAGVEVSEEVAVVQGAVAAYNAGDVDGFMASVSDDATMFGRSRADDPEAMRDLQAFYMSFDQEFDLVCSADGANVSCQGTIVDDLARAVNRRPEPVDLEATVEDGLVSNLEWTGYNTFQVVRAVAIWTATYQPVFWGERFDDCTTEMNCLTFDDNVRFLANDASGRALVEAAPAYAEDTQTRTADDAGDGPEGDL